MQILKDKILTEGSVTDGDVLKVDGFLNHKMDIDLLNEMAIEFKNRFSECNITKILTLEVSGIGISCLTALQFGVPVILAKKSNSIHIDGPIYKKDVNSPGKITRHTICISKKHLTSNDHVLIIDDMLANGYALSSLIDIVKQSGAVLEGVGICIEKSYKGGGNKFRKQGIRVESLAKIKELKDKEVIFEDA